MRRSAHTILSRSVNFSLCEFNTQHNKRILLIDKVKREEVTRSHHTHTQTQIDQIRITAAAAATWDETNSMSTFRYRRDTHILSEFTLHSSVCVTDYSMILFESMKMVSIRSIFAEKKSFRSLSSPSIELHSSGTRWRYYHTLLTE